MAAVDPFILGHLSHMQPVLYWLDEDPLEPLPHPTLICDVTSDLCIVGAGYTGLWSALLAKEQNPDREVMLDLLDGVDNERTRFAMVRKKPLPFPPEPFRFLFIRLTQWSIQRADKNAGKRNLWLRLLDALGLGFDS